MAPSSPVSDTLRARRLPTRVSKACERCRRHKSRCDAFRPCSLCVRANVECAATACNTANALVNRAPKRKRRGTENREASEQAPDPEPRQDSLPRPAASNASMEPETQTMPHVESRQVSVADGEVDSAMGIAQKIFQLSSQDALDGSRTTSAIPGGDVYSKDREARLDRMSKRRPIVSMLGFSLPDLDTMHTLLEEYFDSVHWFSLVIYEPRFRAQFASIQDGLAYPSQKDFLLLLSTVLGMGAWYRWLRRGSNTDGPDWQAWAQTLLDGAGSKLVDLMSQSSIASVQTCILLGSHYVYYGKPTLSFALLGATIKTAQAIRLHQQPVRGDRETVEERKRVWWSIYTWDRFASVTYGRPLGINDRDCSITQPVDVHESPYFKPDNIRAEEVCYSPYQRELNKLYLIASPIIEIIFSLRADGSNSRNNHMAGQHYLAQMMELADRLWAWRRQLPPDLLLDLTCDYDPNPPNNTLRVRRLQALALQLTFDNLLIIVHRPLLAQQVDRLIKNQSENGQPSTQPPASSSSSSPQSPSSSLSPSLFHTANLNSPLSASHMSSRDQWWNAALRTSKVTGLSRLAQLATDTHLVAFLAINLFNSAMVMVVMALSDPLSDKAQEVKRTITRIFRLQELLAKKTTLSVQSNLVLKDVIKILLRREAEAMLAPVVSSEPRRTMADGEPTPMASQIPLMSVEDTLRLPMPLGAVSAAVSVNNDNCNTNIVATTTTTAVINNTSNSNNSNQQRNLPMDRVFRLNESLASVQRVVPPNLHGLSDDLVDNATSQDMLPDGGNGGDVDTTAWYNPDLQTVYDDGWESRDNNVDMAANGLYWFWDPDWSETHPGGNCDDR